MSSAVISQFRDYIANLTSLSTDILPECSYYTEQEFNDAWSRLNIKTHEVSIFHVNIRSLNAHHDELLQLMITLNYSFDVIVLSEICNFNIAIYGNLLPDFNFVYEVPSQSNIGGVGIFIRNSFSFIKRDDLNLISKGSEDKTECLFIEVFKNNYHCIVGGLYRHPNQNIENFSMSLEASIQSKSLPRNIDCFLLGDLNINLLNYQSHTGTKIFLDMLNTYNFLPLTTLPTRLTDTTATLIDHIYYRSAINLSHSNSSHSFTGILTVDISDHLANFVILQKCSKITNYAERPLIRIFSQRNKEMFEEEIMKYDWIKLVYSAHDADSAYNNFSLSLTTAYEKSFPLIPISRKRYKDKKWITSGLITASEHKNRLYKRWIKTKNKCDREKYMLYKKVYTKLLKSAESNYYKMTFDSKLNTTKSLWNKINNLCCKDTKNSKNKLSILKLSINGNAITDSKVMSEELNNYFCGVGAELAKNLALPKLNLDFKHFLPPSKLNSFVCDSISCKEIKNTIERLKSKKSCGPDSINANFILEFNECLVQPLHHIFNLSITSGIFPSLLKIAKVLPVYKKGDRQSVSNYRPISLLNTFSKIFESIIGDRLTRFLIKYDILYKYQFGFRKKHSTKLALLDSMDMILGVLNENKFVAAIFMDLSKAFDSLDRDILLCKLYNYGIRGSMHSWFKSYLSNRNQYVTINDSNSVMQNVEYGVPQGSVLGPLLFLLYINDLGSIPKLEFSPKIFADDTNVFVYSSNLSDLKIKCQHTINIISDWMLANRLTINCDKTNYMIFSPSKAAVESSDISLYINASQIKKVTVTKYLGIHIDENLDWKIHIQDICQTLRKYVGVFYKLSQKLPIRVLKMLYFALIYPRILYAIEIYANTYMTYLHDLFVLNNRILRIMQHKSFRVPTIDLYKSFNTLPVHKLFQYQLILHAHAIKFNSESLPKFFLANNLRNNDIHTHNTRTSQDFHRISITSIYGNKISSNIYAKLWNSLPKNIKSETRQNIFKHLLKEYLTHNEINV